VKRRDLLLILVELCGNRPEFGRTSLQKVAYFVGITLGVPLGHRAHYYGPYSEFVEREIDALVLSGLIEEKVEVLGFIGQRGHEGKRYEYSVTPEGERRIKELQRTYPKEYGKVEQFVGSLTSAANGLDQRILSPAAKTLFIAKREGRALDISEIGELAKQLGWHLNKEQVDRVVNVLAGIDLIRVE
jgi:uncharacterized protein YwgA